MTTVALDFDELLHDWRVVAEYDGVELVRCRICTTEVIREPVLQNP